MKHAFKFTLNMGVYEGKCAQCGQDYRVKVTTQCPEGKLCDDIAKRVQSGQLDFKDGSWVNLKPDQEESKPKITVVDSLSSLFEFMEAMVPELSPEASDELTDEDIDLMEHINSVPLPVSCVRELRLPVDQLVSLHKLKRLDYVWFNGLSSSYMLKDKGTEYLDSLKPKPVTLDIGKLHVLVYIYKKHSIVAPISVMKNDFEWLIEHTRFVHPDCNNKDHWTLSPLGKEFIDGILNTHLLFI